MTMLAKIAAFTETHRPRAEPRRAARVRCTRQAEVDHRRPHGLARGARARTVPCDVVLVPTRSGTTARIISRFNPSVWIVAPSRDAAVCQGLAFSYGVHPVDLPTSRPTGANSPRSGCRSGLTAERVMLVAGLRRAIRMPTIALSSCASRLGE